MITWWASLTVGMKILWGITIASSLIFIIETILTFIGAGGGDLDGVDAGGMDLGGDLDAAGTDGGFDVDPAMNLLTFRNLVNFCLGFGWTSVLLYDKIGSKGLLLLVATLVGVALVIAVMFLFKWLAGMQQSGNINLYASAKGCEGTTYLTIPAERSGQGKVQITINNSVREYDAVTDGDEIRTGKSIKVVEVINERTLLVEPLDSTII